MEERLRRKLTEYRGRLRKYQDDYDFQSPEVLALGKTEDYLADSWVKIAVLSELLEKGVVDHDSLAAQLKDDKCFVWQAYETAFGVIKKYNASQSDSVRGGTGL